MAYTKGDRARIAYLPGLDGLRALAVVAVLLYHADLAWIPGGFLGVELFFVLSGYLITALLRAEWTAQGRIDLKTFWLHRARRLLPALGLLIGSVLAYAVLFLPDQVAGLRAEAVAAAGYASNWVLILARRSYFETMGRPSLLRHLWSLAVEGQFYLLWPPIFAFASRRWPRRRVLLGVLATAMASTLLMAFLYDPNVDPSRVYFGTDTRAAGLLVGVALALIRTPGREKKPDGRLGSLWFDGVGLAALAVLACGCLWIDEFQPVLYRGGFAAVALATAVLIAVVADPRSRLVPRLLGAAPLRWIGRRSYGLYLWHWPLFVLTRPYLDVPLDGMPLLVLRLLATGLLAELSYRLVEVPIRKGTLQQAWGTLRRAHGMRRLWIGMQWAGAIGALALFCVAIGESVVTATPPQPASYLPNEPGDTVMPIEAVVSASVADVVAPGNAAASASLTRSDETTGLAGMPAPTVTPFALTPAASAAAIGVTPTTFPRQMVPTWIMSPTVMAPAGAPPDVYPPVRTVPDNPSWPGTLSPPPGEDVLAVPLLHSTPILTVTAIGDSVMLGAARELKQAVEHIQIDAAVGRQAPDAIRILRAQRDAGQLGRVVVIHLGSNGIFRDEQFEEMMQILANVDVVAFVNVQVPRRWQDPVNTMLVEGVSRYPNAVIVDWHAASTERPELCPKDGVHVSPEGARVYAELIAACVRHFLVRLGAG
ncbi:MAG: acetyltransferase [Anaerolineae bacterium]|nr:acetyltransferase [Anaerolineae bacterium]